MSLTETFWWYLENILEYFFQMLPCMGIALLIFLLLRPWRLGRLARLGLSSGPAREGALLLFVMFAAGLAALTGALARRAGWDTAPVPARGSPGSAPDHPAGALSGDFSGCSGALGHVPRGGQRRDIFPGGLFYRSALEKAPVVEVPAGGLLRLVYHRIDPIFHWPQHRY